MATFTFKSEEFADKTKNQIELSKTTTVKETFTIESLESQLASLEAQIVSITATKTAVVKKIADAKKALEIA